MDEADRQSCVQLNAPRRAPAAARHHRRYRQRAGGGRGVDRHRGPFVPRSPHTGLSASATVLRQVSATVDQVEQTTLKPINCSKD